MKKNRFTVMSPVSKATGHLPDHLDFAVETLSDRIGDAMLKVSQDIGKTPFQGLRRLNYSAEPAVSSPEIPALKIILGILLLLAFLAFPLKAKAIFYPDINSSCCRIKLNFGHFPWTSKARRAS